MEIKEVNLTEEMIRQAKACGSAEELIALAKENGRELTEEEAAEYLEKIHPAAGELSDDELDNVAGGCGDSNKYITNMNGNCSACGQPLVSKRYGQSGSYWYCSNCDKRTSSPYAK